ncbi:MAG: lipopolysaccharide biosynthesis protein [Candidatus Pacebacteria bacterium]|nr:lipopolysaccharide biosynthesis protein [Candidatus Paceibacterota bacterium]
MRTRILTVMLHSMFKNSIFPLLAAIVTSGFGFLFWLFTARLYLDHEVGLAATLTSVLMLIATFSLVGFDTATIRFLEKEPNKNKSISTGFAVVGLAALTISGTYTLLVPYFSPILSTLTDTPAAAALFITFSLFAALNIYTDAIFLAYRKTQYTLAIDTAFSVLKVCLPFAFVEWGAFGIFLAGAVAQASGFLLSVTALVRSFGYRPLSGIDLSFISRTWRFTADSYISDVLGFIPLAALPILVTNSLGPAQAAYYSIVMLIAGLLYTIPASVMNALFAESSHDEGSTALYLRHAAGIVASLLLPSIILLILIGPFLLSAFGGTYSTEGSTLLALLAIGGIPVTVSSIYATLFRIAKDTHALVLRNLIFAISIAGLFPLLIPFGLTGLGVTYLGSATLSALACHLLFQYRARHYELLPIRSLAKRLSLRHITASTVLHLKECFVWPLKTTVISRIRYLQARSKSGTTITVLTYPERPRTFHILYRVFHELGWRITNDPNEPADIRMRFKDTTVWHADETLATLRETHPVLNAYCEDIGKSHVEDVFSRIFGYGTRVDPRTYSGMCVRKSESNAVHDGTLISCPCEPQDGYLYQQFIPTAHADGQMMDMRVSIFCGEIVLVMQRFRAPNDPFNITVAEKMFSAEELLSPDEVARIRSMCTEIGLDYGELDLLRDVRDQRLYVVDVNNTPAGPIGPVYVDPQEFEHWLSTMCEAAKRTFLHFGKDTHPPR